MNVKAKENERLSLSLSLSEIKLCRVPSKGHSLKGERVKAEAEEGPDMRQA